MPAWKKQNSEAEHHSVRGRITQKPSISVRSRRTQERSISVELEGARANRQHSY